MHLHMVTRGFMAELKQECYDPNGGDLPSRVSRIEEAIVLLTNRQVAYEENRISWHQEHKQLLTAQVLLNDTMQKLAEAQRRTDGEDGRADRCGGWSGPTKRKIFPSSAGYNDDSHESSRFRVA